MNTHTGIIVDRKIVDEVARALPPQDRDVLTKQFVDATPDNLKLVDAGARQTAEAELRKRGLYPNAPASGSGTNAGAGT